uniref:RRM domain-containing protein n=1 Tax=Parascaris univalens TaxID=6257 RepID=A0A915BUW2_PARUN
MWRETFLMITTVITLNPYHSIYRHRRSNISHTLRTLDKSFILH